MITLGMVSQGSGGFTCNSTICYSYNSPATNQLFQRLQDLLNKAGAKLSLGGGLAVDGRIGIATVNLAHRISDKAGNLLPYLFAMNLDGEGWTKENLAKHADVVVPELARFVGEAPTSTPDTTQLPSNQLPVNPWANVSQTVAPYPPTAAFPSLQPPVQQTAPPPGVPEAGPQVTVTPPQTAPAAPQYYSPITVAPSKTPIIIAGILSATALIGVFAFTRKKGA